MVVHRQVRLQPHNSLQIQMVRRLIEKEQVRLDKQRTSQRNTHTPTTAHVLGGPLHHRLGKPKTVQDAARLGLERAGVHLLELFVRRIERHLVDVVCDGELFDALLELSDFGFGGRDDVVDGVDVRGLSFAADEVDIYVVRDRDIALGDGLEECRLDICERERKRRDRVRMYVERNEYRIAFTFPDPLSPRRPYRCP